MGFVRDLKVINAARNFVGEFKKGNGDMKKLIAPTLTFAGTLAALFAPELQAYIIAHPQAATVLAGIAAIASNFAPQPHK